MIADKVLKSFYVVEVEGEACSSIISGNFGIAKMALESTDYSNDLLAMGDLKKAINFIVSNKVVDPLIETKEEIVYNPEFFPSLKAIELTPVQQTDLERAEAAVNEMQEALSNTDKSAVVLSRIFDVLGDFVEMRWTVEAQDFKIVGRVAADPEQYLQHKGLSDAIKRGELLTSTVQNTLTVH